MAVEVLDMTKLEISPGEGAANEVGICYFNAIDEKMVELNQQSNLITVGSGGESLKIYYLVIGQNLMSSIKYVNVKVSSVAATEQFYDIKLIASDLNIQVSDFENVPLYHSVTVNSPTPGIYIPLHVYIKPKTIVNDVLDLNFEVEYE